MVRKLLGVVVPLALLTFPGSPARATAPDDRAILDQALPPAAIARKLGRYEPVSLGVPPASIPADLMPMLGPLREAADTIDRIYWEQVSPEGRAMLDVLSASGKKEAQALARFLQIQYGPWDAYADDAPFIGSAHRPLGANFYPRDVSRRELDARVDGDPAVLERVWSPYTVVVRHNGTLDGVPYAQAYGDLLKRAATSLVEAADAYKCSGAACPCAPFADFLRARAASLLSDDYRKSEVLWLFARDCPIDAAIGPYEFYEDRLLGLKTAFEAIVYWRDSAETEHYAKVGDRLEALVKALPMSDAVRQRFLAVRPSPITVGDVLYTAGGARAGFQIRAFLLPNDEEIQRTRGTKNVILRNVVRAKFEKLATRVARRVLTDDLAKKVEFDTYFDFLVAWQLAHAVVPEPLEGAGGITTDVRFQLRGRYAYIEQVKGEVVALLNQFALVDAGVFHAAGDDAVIATYLAGLFDGIRLAGGTPQTMARTIVYNWLARAWAVRYDPGARRFEVNPSALRPAVRGLAAEALEILGRGDYDGAGRLIVQFGIMPGEMREKLATLEDLPLDVLPNYTSMAAP